MVALFEQSSVRFIRVMFSAVALNGTITISPSTLCSTSGTGYSKTPSFPKSWCKTAKRVSAATNVCTVTLTS